MRRSPGAEQAACICGDGEDYFQQETNEDDSSDKYGSYMFKSGRLTAPFSNLDNSDLEPAF